MGRHSWQTEPTDASHQASPQDNPRVPPYDPNNQVDVRSHEVMHHRAGKIGGKEGKVDFKGPWTCQHGRDPIAHATCEEKRQRRPRRGADCLVYKAGRSWDRTTQQWVDATSVRPLTKELEKPKALRDNWKYYPEGTIVVGHSAPEAPTSKRPRNRHFLNGKAYRRIEKARAKAARQSATTVPMQARVAAQVGRRHELQARARDRNNERLKAERSPATTQSPNDTADSITQTARKRAKVAAIMNARQQARAAAIAAEDERTCTQQGLRDRACLRTNARRRARGALQRLVTGWRARSLAAGIRTIARFERLERIDRSSDSCKAAQVFEAVLPDDCQSSDEFPCESSEDEEDESGDCESSDECESPDEFPCESSEDEEDEVDARPAVRAHQSARDSCARARAKFPSSLPHRLDRVLNLGEVLHHPSELWLYQAPERGRPVDEFKETWRHDGSQYRLASNSADVRFPRPCPERHTHDTGTRRAWDLKEQSTLAHDLAQVCARMGTGEYHSLAIAPTFKRAAFSTKNKDTVGVMLDDMLSDRPALKFCEEFNAEELVQEHRRRFAIPDRKPRIMTVCCGVSGDGIASQAQYAKVEVFVDACKEACKQLKRTFPHATVLCMDITNPKNQRELVSRYAGKIDAVLLAFPCQPSSDANPHKVADDPRLNVADEATKVAIVLRPRMIMCENVASFKTAHGGKPYKRILNYLEKHGKYETETVITNAAHCMVPQQRSRMFLIATKYDGGQESVQDLIRANEIQKTLYNLAQAELKQRKQRRTELGKSHRITVDLKTCPTVRQLLETYESLKQYDGMFVHQLRRMSRDKPLPQRIIDLDDIAPTLTSKYRQSEVCYDNYDGAKPDQQPDHVVKQRALLPTGAQLGVLSGFAMKHEWSEATSCPTKCVGCFSKGKSRGRPGDLQRGNVVAPAQVLFLMWHLIRPLAHACANGPSPPSVDHLACVKGYEFMLDTPQRAVNRAVRSRTVVSAVVHRVALKHLRDLMDKQPKDRKLSEISLCVWLKRRLDRLSKGSELGAMAPTGRAIGTWVFEQRASSVRAGLKRAIIDSGASGHFSSGDSVLRDAQPSNGSVTVANEQHERIAEIGSVWPLHGVNKVNSFDKSLVSVARLCELVGSIKFCEDGTVRAVSVRGGKTGETVIGKLNPTSNLYDYSQGGLEQHCQDHKALLPTQERGNAVYTTNARDKWQDTIRQSSRWKYIESRDELIGDLGRTESSSAANTTHRDQQDGSWRAYVTVSDEQARIQVIKLHQIFNHCSMKTILKLYDQGQIMGLKDITRDQLLGIQFFCKSCARGKMTRRPWSRKTKAKKFPKGKVGERFYVDVIHRQTTSVEFIDDLGRKGGGNRYTLIYICVVSNRIFLQHFKEKDKVEELISKMMKLMAIECTTAGDYDDRAPTKVKELISDRDSNMTSYVSTNQALISGTKLTFTSSGGTNQTPLLDNVVRRLLTHTRTALLDSGFDMNCWEFAMNHGAQMMGLMPTSSNEGGLSPALRWSGEKVMDMLAVERHTFGADCYVFVPQGKREGGEKVGPTGEGGHGRYRFLGEATGLGHSSKGSLILDTKLWRTKAMRDFKCNDDVSDMENLKYPLRSGENDWDERKRISDDEFKKSDTRLPASIGQRHIEPEAHDEPMEVSTDESEPADDGMVTRGSLSSSVYETVEENETFRTVADNLRLNGQCDVNGKEFTVQRLIDLNAFWMASKHGRSRLSSRTRLQTGTKLWLVDEPDDLVTLSEHVMHAKLRSSRELKGLLVEEDLKDQKKTPCEARYAAHTRHYEQCEAHDTVVDVAGCSVVVDESVATIPYWQCASEALPVLDPHMNTIIQLCHEMVHGADATSTARFDEFTARAEKVFADATTAHWSAVTDGMEAGESRARAETKLRASAQCAVQAMAVKGMENVKAKSIPQPRNYWEAIKGDFKKLWDDAIQAELKNLATHKVFKWVDPPPGMKIRLDSSWAFKAKPNNKGFLDRAKARLVARGFRQLYGVDYIHTMAPVGKIVTFRIMLAEMARRGMDLNILDVKSAYLEADLDIPQYMKAPAGVRPPRPGQVMKLLKGLYGLRNAGRGWSDKFRGDLVSWGFEACNADSCLFQKRSEKDGSLMRILLFVDDMAITSDKGSHLYADLVAKVKEKYEFSKSEDAHVFLGMSVTRVSEHVVFLGQQRYLDELLTKYKVKNHKARHSVQPTGVISKEDCPDCDPGKNPLAKSYREMIGELRWIERCTRPDLATALSELGKVQLNPGQVHMDRLRHLMEYLSTTRDYGITFGVDRPTEAVGPMVGFVDANWGGDCDDYRSRGGYVFKSWGAPVSWASFRLQSVALSSCEAEFMAASEATKQATWLRYLMSDMGYGDLGIQQFGTLCDRDYVKAKLSGNLHRGEIPITIFEDNKGTIALSENDVLHKRSRHIHIRYMFVRHHYKKGHVELVYVNTKENVADIMTKVLKSKVQHKYLLSKLLCELRNGTLVSVYDERVPCSPRPQAVDDVDMSLARKPWSQTFARSGWELRETQASSQSAIYDHDCNCEETSNARTVSPLLQRLNVGLQVRLRRLEASRLCKGVRAWLAQPCSQARSRVVNGLRALLRV